MPKPPSKSLAFEPAHMDAPGGELMARALQERNLELLADTLAVHPSAWETSIRKVNLHKGWADTSSAIDAAVGMGWTKGVAAMHQAGATPSEATLGIAAYHGRHGTLRWMLDNGFHGGEKAIQEALCKLVLGFHQKSNLDSYGKCAQHLVEAGAHVWHQPKNESLLPIQALKKGYPALAARLIEMGETPHTLGWFVDNWFMNITHGLPQHHHEILDALAKQQRLPALETMSCEYAKTYDVGLPKERKIRELAVIQARAQMPFNPDDGRQAMNMLGSKPEAHHIASLIESRLIEQETENNPSQPTRTARRI